MVLSVALHATLNTKSFLKSLGQELSESIVHINGTQIFANLDFREVCITILIVFSTMDYNMQSFLVLRFKGLLFPLAPS